MTMFSESVAHKYFYSKDNFLYYEKVGYGSKKIILLHGFGASHESFFDLKKEFQESEFTLYLLDLKGHGESSKPFDNDYSIEDQADIIHKFIIDNIEYQCTLIGHSFGGGVSIMTILKDLEFKANKISSAILIDAAALKDKLPFFVSLLKNPILNFFSYLSFPKYRAEFTLKRLFFDKNKVNENIINRYAKYFKKEDTRYSLTKTAEQIIPKNYEKLITKYSLIKIPILIIWGEDDKAIPLINGEKLNSLLENSHLEIIKKCGHIPHEEHPNKTFALINKFIKKTYDK